MNFQSYLTSKDFQISGKISLLHTVTNLQTQKKGDTAYRKTFTLFKK